MLKIYINAYTTRLLCDNQMLEFIHGVAESWWNAVWIYSKKTFMAKKHGVELWIHGKMLD